MLTDADIKKLSKTLATKDDIGALGKRIGGIETRMNGLEGRMGGIETRMEGVENHIGGLELSFLNFQQNADARFLRLEDKVDRLANSI